MRSKFLSTFSIYFYIIYFISFFIIFFHIFIFFIYILYPFYIIYFFIFLLYFIFLFIYNFIFYISNLISFSFKYNVEIVGAPGGGGEYDVQLGFGWTNGVALRFLTHFGGRLSSIPNGASPGITNPSMASVGDQDLTTGGAGVNNWSSAMAVAAPLVSVALSLR